MKKIKTAYIDLETGGLSAWKNPVLQIAGIIDINDQEVERFNFSVAPMANQEIHPEALQVTGLTRKQIEGFPAAHIVFSKLQSILKKYADPFDKSDKLYLSGYNTKFDEEFLRAFWKNNGDKYFGSFFHFPAMDVAIIAAEYFKPHRHNIPSFKLTEVGKRLFPDLNVEDAHDAMFDIELTRNIYLELKRRQNGQS